MTQPIGFTVIGGYLGAGKTTLVNRLLRHAGGRRIGVVVNDFGALNIDAELIRDAADDQINLTNGCICCGLADGFVDAIERLTCATPRLDQIVVEASGVADVAVLARYGHAPGRFPDGVIVVADAETVRAKANDKYVAATVTRQLRAADLVVLNKADLVDAAALDAVERWLAELSSAPVVRCEHCVVPMELLTGLPRVGVDAEPVHDHHEQYRTWRFEGSHAVRRERVEAFLDSLPAAALRVKGFVNVDGTRLLLQKVGSRWTLTDTATAGTTELVAIGLATDLSIDDLETAAQALRDSD